MTHSPRILAFAGSAREDSANFKLVKAAAQAAEASDAHVELINLADFPAPVYNGDDEQQQGLPPAMAELRQMIADSDGLIIATPEYNGHLPPLLVNLFSWVSRPHGDQGANAAFTAKPVAMMAASPGGLGGIRVIPRLRDFVAEHGCMAIPGFVTLANAYEAFDDEGILTQAATLSQLQQLTARLVNTARIQ